MLKEYPAFQRSGELPRRWFSDDYFDLITWCDVSGGVAGFQLCYDKRGCERSLLWYQDQGFRHDAIDQGETHPVKNLSPILVPDGVIPEDVASIFTARSKDIESRITEFVLLKIKEYLGTPCIQNK